MQRCVFKIWLSISLVLISAAVFAQPSLLPLPQELKWNNDRFMLKSCKAIITDSIFLHEAEWLKALLGKHRFYVPISFNGPQQGSGIIIKAAQVNDPQHAGGAYTLKIT